MDQKISDLLGYDPSSPSGLRWKVDRPGGKVKAGDIAGCFKISDGYYRVKILGKSYLVHRIIYELIKGFPPPEKLDHINGNKSDNRIENLRECSQAENSRNTKTRSDNASGVKGVTWLARSKKWVAQCMLDGKQKHIGMYTTIEEATEAVVAYRQEHHKDFARHK